MLVSALRISTGPKQAAPLWTAQRKRYATLEFMRNSQLKKCFSCGAMVEDIDGPVHPYMASSPGCWAAYGVVLAREYSDVMYAPNHRLTVDAYASQHPGNNSPQSIQSVAVHLASLCMIFENGASPSEATRLIKKLSKQKSTYFWLEPPKNLGLITVRDVLHEAEAENHVNAVREWAKLTWMAWEKHHGQVKEWMAPYK